MPRTARVQFEGATYHILNRGNNRESIFINEADYLLYLQLLERYCEEFNVLLYAYVLMPNHLHLLLETPSGSIVDFMRSLNTCYTMRFNRKNGRIGHVFQGRYKSFIVDKDNYLLELSRYIHLNPVRAGIVKDPKDYRWSSYRDYVGESDGIVRKEFILSQFSPNEKKSFSAYNTFVMAAIESGDLRGDFVIRKQQFVGSEDFVERIIGPDTRKPCSTKVSIHDVIQAICHHFNISENVILSHTIRQKDRIYRDLIIYLTRRLTSLKLKEIGSFFGIKQPATSLSIRKVENLMEYDEKIKGDIKMINNNLMQRP